jgi:hypothetical protein
MNSLLSSARQTVPALQTVLLSRKRDAPNPRRYDKALQILNHCIRALADASQGTREVKQLRGHARTAEELASVREAVDFATAEMQKAERNYNNALLRCYRLLGKTSTV